MVSRIRTDETTQTGSGRVLGRRRLLRGSALAGVGLAGATTADWLGLRTSGTARAEPSGVGARTFLPASSFEGAVQQLGDWKVQSFGPATESNVLGTVGIPGNASSVSVEIIWVADEQGAGSVRWTAGLLRAEPTVPHDQSSNGQWLAINAPVPATKKAVVSTRLAEYSMSPDVAAARVMITREAANAADDFPGSAHLLGIAVTVVSSPFT
ncbi:hypothetical protein [Tsukamurella hominis]|uniref:hypothetical protein n=1 Tax=Tsukamurella hominis TaxID=1970232 RepID=UPI0039EBE991